jgi:hypothetical protein
MALTVLITLTTAGADTGPFDLYSNVDGYTVPFESGVAKLDLESGYVSYSVPDDTSSIRVQSVNALCENYIDLTIEETTTTTTTSEEPPTTTTTTSEGVVMFIVRYGASLETVCSGGLDPVYTGGGETISPGSTIYTDPSLTVLLTGQNYIVEEGVGDIYNIDSGTGVIGSDTASDC